MIDRKPTFDSEKSLSELADANMMGMPRSHDEHFREHCETVRECGYIHPMRRPKLP